MTETRIVEIGGVKMELDMRQAKVQSIDTFKVGDNVKVLIKDYGDSYKTHAGVIAGFDNFKALPTIVVVYLEIGYNDAKLKTAYINAKTEGTELVAAAQNDIPLERDTVIDLMDRDIASKEIALRESQRNKTMFLQMFNRYFADHAKVAEQVESV